MEFGHGPDKDGALCVQGLKPDEPVYSDGGGKIAVRKRFKYLGLEVHEDVASWYSKFPALL